MTEEFKSRVVIRLSDVFAKAVGDDGLHYSNDPALEPLKKALAPHKAELHNQLRDFEYYVQSSEAHGLTTGPMIDWTRDASAHPYAQAKYSKLFAVAVAGKKIFDQEHAEKLAADLQPLVGQGVVELVKIDSMDPAKNPPIPAKYFR